jgi:transposase-like protein
MRTPTPATLRKKWQELIRQQQESKLSVSAFCRQHDFSDQSFYNWWKRLAADRPVRFALVDANWEPTESHRWN